MEAIIILLLLFIKHSQLQEITTLYNCTFDYGLVEDCIFHALLTPGDNLEIDAGQALNTDAIDPPDRPLSDATSVFSPTTNGEICQFPYELNGWNMHFCLYEENTTDYICPTKSGNQTCVKGQYGYKTTSNPLGFLDIYRSTTMILTNSTDTKQCLSFYYYFSNNYQDSTITFRMHPNLTTLNSSTIVIVKPTNENKWSYSQTSFLPGTEAYYLTFVLYQTKDFIDTSMFTFALDNISITSGLCPTINNDSITTDMLILNETSTISIDSKTSTTKKNPTTSTQTSITTPSISILTTNPTTTTTLRPSTTSQSISTTKITFPSHTKTKRTTITSTTSSYYIITTVSKSQRLVPILGLSMGLGTPILLSIIAIFLQVIKSII